MVRESLGNLDIDYTSNQDGENMSESNSDSASPMSQDYL